MALRTAALLCFLLSPALCTCMHTGSGTEGSAEPAKRAGGVHFSAADKATGATPRDQVRGCDGAMPESASNVTFILFAMHSTYAYAPGPPHCFAHCTDGERTPDIISHNAHYTGLLAEN